MEFSGRHTARKRHERALTLLRPGGLMVADNVLWGGSVANPQKTDADTQALRERYPHARLQVENRAIGGFAANFLYRSAQADHWPFYPDLLVFHVYGDHRRYEEIIHDTRQRTAAEVMIMTDHWRRGDLQEDGSLAMGDWARFYDEQVLPKVAEKYQCELVDVRWPWKRLASCSKRVAASFARCASRTASTSSAVFVARISVTTSSVSGATDFLVAGEGAGQTKLDDAAAEEVEVIDPETFRERFLSALDGVEA